MSLLSEFRGRWPRQDKQAAAGRKMAESSGTISGGQLEGRKTTAVHMRQGGDTPGNTLTPFRSCVRPRFCYSLVFGSREKMATPYVSKPQNHKFEN